MTEKLMVEMEQNQTFGPFRHEVKVGLEKQEENEKYRKEEQELNVDLKRIADELKKQQDEFAKEAQESLDDITKFKKMVNEAQTESELLTKYYQSLFNGELQCIERLNSRKEMEIRNKITDLK